MGAAAELVRGALDYLFGGPAVGGADLDRLRRWCALPEPDLVAPHAQSRYVAVATGMPPGERRKPVGAIAAVAIEGLRIDFAGCVAIPLRGSADAKRSMLDFLEFVQKSLLVAFDARAEHARLARTTKSLLGVPLRHPCVDLGELLRCLVRDARAGSLDEWLAHFGIGSPMREAPLFDALACAELALIALEAAARAGATNGRGLLDLAHEAARRP